MKILVCLPYYQDIAAGCTAGLTALENSTKHQYTVLRAKGVEVALARNIMLEPYKQFDKVLTVDSDISFTEEDVSVLISMDKDVCSLPYIRRGMLNRYLAGDWEDSDPNKEMQHYPLNTKGICPVEFVGAGFTLYSTKILDEKFYPWYRHPIVDSKTALFGKMIQCEDIGFCMYLKEKKIPIYVNFDRPVDHRLIDEKRTFRFTAHEIDSITEGLEELKHKIANPLLQNIAKQLRER